ncbi:hypothetical protein EDB19DRAFT_1835333 [Suillus lakei]|nr:hypothetical protein EDB19DRAFT_1835333 [Suillus lakei]
MMFRTPPCPASVLDIVVTGVDAAKVSTQSLIAVVRNTLDHVKLQSERLRWWSTGQRTCQYGPWEEENEDARIKLFLDSAKDAKEQGQKKKQSGTSRDIFYSQVAQAVFSNDEDLEFQPVLAQSLIRCFRLKRKYNEFNKELKQSGAGKTYAELQEDPKMKLLIDTKLEKFPWWSELHGWWRMNPAFNHTFSTADAGQDFVSAALEHFKQSQPLATCDDDTHTDDDPEDIVELGDGAMDGVPPHGIIWITILGTVTAVAFGPWS